MRAVNDVRDIGAIETLAKIDEQLRGNQFLGSEHASGNAENDRLRAAVNPGLIDRNDGIAHARDEVDEIAVTMGLGQPDRVADLGFEALLLQMPQRLRHRLRRQEQIKVLSITPDSGVFLQRERAGNNIRDASAIHVLQNFTE